MRGQEVHAVLYLLKHDIDIGSIERRCPDIILIGETTQEVARTGAAVPDIILILPVFTEHIGEVFLAFLHPDSGSEIAAFTLAYILRHKQVAPFYNLVPIFLFRRARIF